MVRVQKARKHRQGSDHSSDPMALDPKSRYPSRRAYVLKVRSDARPDAIAGRLENLVTGQQCDFASGRELLGSLAADLETSAAERTGDEPRK